MSNCPLCLPSESTILTVGPWSVRLNDDQKFLGRCYFALDRHETDVTKLSPDELLSLWDIMRDTKAALDRLFMPDHYNYVFLMNLTAHLHPHIIPRYAQPREFMGEQFVDGRLGSHYDIIDTRIPSKEVRAALVTRIREELTS